VGDPTGHVTGATAVAGAALIVVFFLTHEARAPLREFFGTWAYGFSDRVRLVYYDTLARTRKLPGAHTYVFTDLERLTPAGLKWTAELADMLAARDEAPQILNHPRHVLRRYDFQRALYERGVNPFRVHRALSVPGDVRFPVFLRSEHEHRVRTPLLRDAQELERELDRVRAEGDDLSTLLVVEYEDVADDDGLYHRHISHLVGDSIVPGYVAYSPNWEVKWGPFLDGERLESQRASVLAHEHDPLFLELAELAGVQYGRFDYAIAGGRVIVWELNTNPTMLARPSEHSNWGLGQVLPHTGRVVAAYEQLAGEPGDGLPPVSFRAPSDQLVVGSPGKEPLRVRVRLAPGIGPMLWINERRMIRNAVARRSARAAEG
jgi:hypothetical protein